MKNLGDDTTFLVEDASNGEILRVSTESIEGEGCNA
jgi:hypothetical protein